MDYTDIYLRQRKKDHPEPRPVVVVESEAASEQRVERVLKGAFSVQQLVDRIEELSARVDTFDEKMVNLTKLVKLAQSLQEEKEGDLRRQQHELRSRLKRQEQITNQLEEELANMREKILSTVRETVIETQQGCINEVMKTRKQSEEELHQIKTGVENTVKEIHNGMKENMASVQREVSMSLSSQQEAQSKLREEFSRLENTMRMLETSTAANESTRLAPLERNMLEVSERLGSLQQKVDAASSTLEAAGAERQRVQDIIMDEIESTRQWATRNLQRVKQHVETLSKDILQLKTDQSDVLARLNRVSCQADIEYKKLRSLLLQKSREAEALGILVGKELEKVEDMAERHQSLRTEAAGTLKGMAF